ncbi:MAG TPA: GFA family protein [Rhizomicrobium sp.]|nr:GFA family protein [Rhizomicrobium sp.]
MTTHQKKGAWRTGGCHCGAVRFDVRTPDEIELVDCNCSMCHRTGYLHLIVGAKDFRLTRGADKITTYTFNTGAAKHLFCAVCGVKSFYVPRSHPDGYSVNFRCLDAPDSFASVSTTEFDGREWEKNAGDLAPLESR